MKMLKIFAAGALSYFAYKAWQRHQAAQADARLDDNSHTPPHGEALLVDVSADDTPAATRPGAQASRGFGEA